MLGSLDGRRSWVPLATLPVVAALALTCLACRSPAAGSAQCTVELVLAETRAKVIGLEDISSYRWTSHELALTARGAERLRAAPKTGADPLAVDFELLVNGGRAYAGKLVSCLASMSFRGPVIELCDGKGESFRIDDGYGEHDPSSVDLRPSPALRACLARAGKLQGES